MQGGCVDSTSQSLACVMMTLGDQDVSKLQTGPLSPYTLVLVSILSVFVCIGFVVCVYSSAERFVRLDFSSVLFLETLHVNFH